MFGQLRISIETAQDFALRRGHGLNRAHPLSSKTDGANDDELNLKQLDCVQFKMSLFSGNVSDWADERNT